MTSVHLSRAATTCGVLFSLLVACGGSTKGDDPVDEGPLSSFCSATRPNPGSPCTSSSVTCEYVLLQCIQNVWTQGTNFGCPA